MSFVPQFPDKTLNRVASLLWSFLNHGPAPHQPQPVIRIHRWGTIKSFKLEIVLTSPLSSDLSNQAISKNKYFYVSFLYLPILLCSRFVLNWECWVLSITPCILVDIIYYIPMCNSNPIIQFDVWDDGCSSCRSIISGPDQCTVYIRYWVNS